MAFDTNRDGNYEVYVMNSDGSGAINLSHSPRHDLFSVWSPDGRWIAYSSYYRPDDGSYDPNENGDMDIFLVDVSGLP